MDNKADLIAEKVRAILERSALEPGIREMNELMRATSDDRQVAQSFVDMLPHEFTTQTSHSHY